MDPINGSAGERDGHGPSITRETLYGLGRQASSAATEKTRRLSGVVASGVERNSWILVGRQGEVLAQLFGGPGSVLAQGRAVTVTGAFLAELRTTAQQGRAFRVDAAEPDAAPQEPPG